MVRKYLSNKERIILHLSSFSGEISYFNAPLSLTQEGIAESVGIGRNNVPRELRKLMEEGLVTSQKARVSGLRNKRNIYSLTPEGIERARNIRHRVEKLEVKVITVEGTTHTVVMRDLPKRFGVNFITATLKLDKNLTLDLTTLSDGSRRVHMIDENSVMGKFYGRRDEMEQLKYWLQHDKRVLLLTGMPGIGKTTLMLKFIKKYAHNKNVFFIKIKKNDITFDLAYRLGKFYTRVGRPMLERYMRAVFRSGSPNNHCENIRQLIMKTVGDEIVIFDNVENASPSVRNAIRWFISIMDRTKKYRVAIIGTDVHGIVPLSKLPMTIELKLDELSREDSLRMLRDFGIREENATKLVDKYGGNPLILSLARTNDTIVIRRYILEGVLSQLKADEMRAVEFLSVFNRPVNMGAFLRQGIEYPVIYSLINKNILKEYELEVYSLPPLIANFVYERLSEESRKKYHYQAGRYYLESGEFLDAVYHFVRGGDIVQAGILLSERYHEYVYKNPGYLKSIALDILNGADDAVEEIEWNMCGIVGEISLLEGKWDEAQEYFYRAMRLAENHDASYWAFSGVKMAEILGKRGEVDEAIKILEYILTHRDHVSRKEHISFAYYALGNLLRIKGRVEEAIEMMEEAVKIAESAGDLVTLGYAYKGMGVLMKQKEDYDAAREYFERAKKCFVAANDQVGIIKATRDIGALYYRMKDPVCEKYLREALGLAEKIGDRYNVALLYRDLGNWYMCSEKYDESLDYLKKSEAVLSEIKTVEDLAYLYNSLGIYYGYLGDPEHGKEYFEKALSMAMREDNAQLVGLVARCAVSYLERYGESYVEQFRPYATESAKPEKTELQNIPDKK